MFSAADLIIRLLGPTKVIEPSASRRPRSLVWCQPSRDAARVLLRPVPVAVHHRRAACDDLADLAVGDLGAVVVDDADLEQRRRAAVRADRCRARGTVNVIMPITSVWP